MNGYRFSQNLSSIAERRSKMKSSVAIFLCAFIAGLRADDFEELLLADDADDGLPDRHPFVVRMGHFRKIFC